LHADPRTTMRYDNSRELHQMGEKPQVGRATVNYGYGLPRTRRLPRAARRPGPAACLHPARPRRHRRPRYLARRTGASWSHCGPPFEMCYRMGTSFRHAAPPGWCCPVGPACWLPDARTLRMTPCRIHRHRSRDRRLSCGTARQPRAPGTAPDLARHEAARHAEPSADSALSRTTVRDVADGLPGSIWRPAGRRRPGGASPADARVADGADGSAGLELSGLTGSGDHPTSLGHDGTGRTERDDLRATHPCGITAVKGADSAGICEYFVEEASGLRLPCVTIFACRPAGGCGGHRAYRWRRM